MEIGQTKAVKILRYFRDPNIDEIRWYTKNGKLVGKWLSTRKIESFMHSTIDQRFNEEMRYQYELEDLRGIYFDRTYFKCPHCQKAIKVSKAQIKRYAGGYILVCEECKKEFPSPLGL